MTIKDCLQKAIGYLGLRGEQVLEDNSEELLDMARDVVSEICSDYYPLKTCEKIRSDSAGTILIYGLDRTVIDVFALRQNGKPVTFLTKYDRLDTVASGEYEVEYSYLPDMPSIDSVLPFSQRISARVIGYGIAAEYALLHCPEDAALFDKRYKDALKRATAEKRSRHIKRRCWV